MKCRCLLETGTNTVGEIYNWYIDRNIFKDRDDTIVPYNWYRFSTNIDSNVKYNSWFDYSISGEGRDYSKKEFFKHFEIIEEFYEIY